VAGKLSGDQARGSSTYVVVEVAAVECASVGGLLLQASETSQVRRLETAIKLCVSPPEGELVVDMDHQYRYFRFRDGRVRQKETIWLSSNFSYSSQEYG